MRFTCVLAALVACMATAAVATSPIPPSCVGPETGHGGYNCTDRPEQITQWTKPPVFVRSVKNGKLYLGGNGSDTFHVIHLFSDTDNFYDMGFALGQLLPSDINDMFTQMESWLALRLEMAVKWLPDWLAQLVVKYGAPIALDFVYDLTKDYIPKEYLEEWQGIADGANCSIQKIRRVSLFPQLSKAACTILVAHNNATTNGGVNHLRGLDFDPRAPVGNFASVTIYHYKNKPQLANFGWTAMTGVLSGMNDVPMSVSEKKWGGHNAALGLPLGLPWMQMLRKSLEFGSLTEANAYIESVDKATSPTPNSVSIHMGYGDQKSNHIIGWEVGYNYSRSFQWNTEGTSRTHPQYDGIMYWTKNNPARTMCPADMLTAQYGKIDAEWLAMEYAANDKTGDSQVVGFDLQQMKVWFANARKTTADPSSPMCAYYRQRSLLDMKALFSEKPPTA